MTWDEWIASQNLFPTGFEGVGNERMRQVWDAATKAEREACAIVCDDVALTTEPDDLALDTLNEAAEKIRGRP